ncbi:SGNH hydrolase-type esterase domain-containing protein [Chytriomyces sp. MP71]|nr:SGNH hydrolase-type esterase domain-containing protein [Chytriomyces sp. MP71]
MAKANLLQTDKRVLQALAFISTASIIIFLVLCCRESDFSGDDESQWSARPLVAGADPSFPDLSYDQILFLGDGLTDTNETGWAHLLARDYSPVMDSLFRAREGYNIFWLKSALPSLLQTSPPSKLKLVTLLIGENDAKESSQLSSVPYKLYIRCLRDIVNLIHTLAPQAHILVLTPPPMGIQSQQEGSSYRRVKQYRDACLTVVSDMIVNSNGWAMDHLAVMDTWVVLAPEGNFETKQFEPAVLPTTFVDGLRFSNEGHEMIYRAVQSEIEHVWPHLAPHRVIKKLPMPHNGFARAKGGNAEEALKVIIHQ